MKSTLHKQTHFTLIELIVSMAVLTILVLASFTLFTTTQNTWNITGSKQEIFENARIALDLISKDLDSSYFGEGSAPLWHWIPDQSNLNLAQYRNELIAFVSRSPIPPNNDCLSPLFEVKYQLNYSTSHNEDEGWIGRSITGDFIKKDIANTKWNWKDNFKVGYTTATNAFTADNSSSGEQYADGSWVDYHKLIPCVLDLSFSLEAKSGAIMPPDIQTTDNLPNPPYEVNAQQPYYPSLVKITITLMDKSSWDKWISLCGSDVYHAPNYEGTSNPAAKAFRERHQMTFTKSVYLGNRGQQ